jgi:hypothetical protein
MEIDVLFPTGVQMKNLIDRPQLLQEVQKTLKVSVAPVYGIVTVQNKVAVEIKIGASALASRTRVRIHNPDPAIAVRLGGSTVSETAGELLEPRGTVEFELSDAVAIYGRSLGYEVPLEVMES